MDQKIMSNHNNQEPINNYRIIQHIQRVIGNTRSQIKRDKQIAQKILSPHKVIICQIFYQIIIEKAQKILLDLKDQKLARTLYMLLIFFKTNKRLQLIQINKQKKKKKIPQVIPNKNLSNEPQPKEVLFPSLQRFTDSEFQSFTKTVRLNTIVLNQNASFIPQNLRQFIQRRRPKRLFQKKILARSFCYRGYGLQNFRDQIQLWGQALDLDSNRASYNPHLVESCKKLKKILFQQRRNSEVLGQQNTYKSDSLANLYKSVSYSVATDTIRMLQDCLRKQHYKKLKRIPDEEMKYMYKIVLNGEKLLPHYKYKILLRVVKDLYGFEYGKLNQKQLAELYIALLELLRKKIERPLKIDKICGVQQLKKIVNLGAPRFQKSKPLFQTNMSSEQESQEDRRLNLSLKCEQQQKPKIIQKIHNFDQTDTEEEQVQNDLVDFYIKNSVIKEVSRKIEEKYKNRIMTCLQTHYKIQKLIRISLKLCRKKSSFYFPTVPALQRFNDVKVRMILFLPEAVNIRVSLLKLYRQEVVSLQCLSKTVDLINSYVSKIPNKKCEKY